MPTFSAKIRLGSKEALRLRRMGVEVVATLDEYNYPAGRMEIAGDPSPKLQLALSLIEQHLHPLVDAALHYHGKSKESCILCSEVVRTFLYRIGLRDARTVPCFYYLDARRDGELVRAVGIGDPKGHQPGDDDSRWNGHAVVLADGFLIDTTLYGARRPEWDLAGMMAVQLFPPGLDPLYVDGHEVMTGIVNDPDDTGLQLKMMWCSQPTNTHYQSAPDFRERHVRDRVAQQLVDWYRKGEP